MGFLNDQYDIYVGTEPMASKIDVVSEQVGLTTAAVAGMETAVIAQERSSAQQICNKLDVGFFNVVMSQIAQKMANENAKGRALALEMMQQQKALENLQSRMTGDYNMISSRYAKLFGSLNQELKNRIVEIDKPLMDFCTQDARQLQNRIYGLVSCVPILQAENISASQSIAAAHIKSNAQQLISAAGNYIKNDKEKEQTTESLWDNKINVESVYFVPMVVDEEDTDFRKGILNVKESPSLKSISEGAHRQSQQALNSVIDSLQWKRDDQKVSKVISQYHAMVNNANIPQRLKDVMMKLFNSQLMTL